MSEIILIVEVHSAKFSDAGTYFEVPKEQIIKWVSEGAEKRTHWKKYYLLRGPTRVKGVRISNKGNVKVRWFNIQKHTYISFLLNEYEPSDEDLEVAKHMLGL